MVVIPSFRVSVAIRYLLLPQKRGILKGARLGL